MVRRAAASAAARTAAFHVEGSTSSSRPRSWRRGRSTRARRSGRSSSQRTVQAHGRRSRNAAAQSWASRSSRILREPEYGARGEIKNLFVGRDVRGAGVGKALLADAARWLQANGGEPIVIYSFSENRYRRVYEWLGDAVVGERPTDWEGIVVPETAYLWPSAAALLDARRFRGLKRNRRTPGWGPARGASRPPRPAPRQNQPCHRTSRPRCLAQTLPESTPIPLQASSPTRGSRERRLDLVGVFSRPGARRA